MSKNNLIASSPFLIKLEDLINEYYYSKYYRIEEVDGEFLIINDKLKIVDKTLYIKYHKNRYYLYKKNKDSHETWKGGEI